MRRVAVLASLLLVGLASPAPLAGATALQTIVDVERAMLERARERYVAVARQQIDLAAEIAGVRESLDAMVDEREDPDHQRVRELAAMLERVEAQRLAVREAERLLVDRIVQHLQRIESFEARALELGSGRDRAEGRLTGTWELVLMPAGQRGTASLQQTGALVTGTYELAGGWTGSLQGTLVNRKVFLVRIDSKRGKSMELEGYLSSDGQRIRGSWLDYELAGGDGATGQWTAERREEP